MKSELNYNGLPLYNVNVNDFMYLTDCIKNGYRILTRNIQNEDIIDRYKKGKGNSYYICYCDMIIDMRNYKKENI